MIFSRHVFLNVIQSIQPNSICTTRTFYSCFLTKLSLVFNIFSYHHSVTITIKNHPILMVRLQLWIEPSNVNIHIYILLFFDEMKMSEKVLKKCCSKVLPTLLSPFSKCHIYTSSCPNRWNFFLLDRIRWVVGFS